jgi:hypothetical protein
MNLLKGVTEYTDDYLGFGKHVREAGREKYAFSDSENADHNYSQPVYGSHTPTGARC